MSDTRVEALLFDLDGVLVDTEDLVREGWRRAAEDLGVSFSEDDFQHRMLGRRTLEVLTEVFGVDGPRAHELVAAGLDDKTTELIDGVALPPIPGAVDFVRAAAAEGVPRAVVTSASPVNAALALDRLGLSEAVDVVVDAADTVRGKPDPAPYQLAMDRLGTDPATTVVFEDSPAGCAAGIATGARVIGLATTHEAAALRGTHVVVIDFTAFAHRRVGVRRSVAQVLGDVPRGPCSGLTTRG